MARYRDVGAGQIFALGDSFDEILRQLSAEYFGRCLDRARSCLEPDEGSRLALGWMHPGYGVIQPSGMTEDSMEPARLFGWLSGSKQVTRKARIKKLAEDLESGRPRLMLAESSARSYRYTNVESEDHQAALDLFVELALDDPTDWWVMTIAPSREVPAEIWKQHCFAAAYGDKKLERESWKAAKDAYTQIALELLKAGVERTLRCTKPD